MGTQVREQPVRRVGDRGACQLCNPRPDTVPACEVWDRSLELANGLPALTSGARERKDPARG